MNGLGKKSHISVVQNFFKGCSTENECAEY